MSKKISSIGFVLVSIGMVFLLTSLSTKGPIVFWESTLGISIVLNIVGTIFLMQFIKVTKENE